MSDLGERVTRVEASLEFFQKEVSEIKAEMKASRWWIITSVLAALAIIVAVIGLQGSYLREAINQQANQVLSFLDNNLKTTDARLDEFRKDFEARLDEFRKASEARMDEFRRDSDRNYNLARQAFERSMGQAQSAGVSPEPGLNSEASVDESSEDATPAKN